jgi:acylphosphatase
MDTNEPATLRQRIVYRGRVQGVGFRYTVASIARRFPVAGHVKNLRDGTVELVVEGQPVPLKDFLQEIADSFRGNIEDDSTELLDAPEPLARFRIRYW